MMTALNPDAVEFLPTEFFPTGKYAAATQPAAAAPTNCRRKRGVRRKESRAARYLYVCKYKKRCGDGTGRGMSGLLPPKSCLITITHGAVSISEQKYTLACKGTEEKKNSHMTTACKSMS
ncbi:unnamed protein product, partial [Sphacelaria rigidula]